MARLLIIYSALYYYLIRVASVSKWHSACRFPVQAHPIAIRPGKPLLRPGSHRNGSAVRHNAEGPELFDHCLCDADAGEGTGATCPACLLRSAMFIVGLIRMLLAVLRVFPTATPGRQPSSGERISTDQLDGSRVPTLVWPQCIKMSQR